VQILTDLGIDTKYKVADATSLEDTEALADFAWDAYGKVDVIGSWICRWIIFKPFLQSTILGLL